MIDNRDNILTRIARRPFRWFMCGWLTLCLLWLLSGFLGFEWVRHEIRPPDPRAVPYHDYLPGGSREGRLPGFNIAPGNIPAHDETLVTEEYMYTVWQYPIKGDRLIAFQDEGRWRYGWPDAWIWSYRTHYFDVTDPSGGFDPARFPMKDHPFVQHRQQVVWWTLIVDDETGMVMLAIQWGAVVLAMLCLELLAAIPVVLLWAGQRVMWRRRIRDNRCPNCGYDLRGGSEGACPECGAARFESLAAWLAFTIPQRILRSGRWMVAFTLLFFLVWSVLVLISRRDEGIESLETNLARLSENIMSEGMIEPWEVHRDVQLSMRTYGWPLTLMEVRDVQTWQFMSERKPTPSPHFHGFDFFCDSEGMWWTQSGSDETIRRDMNLEWLLWCWNWGPCRCWRCC